MALAVAFFIAYHRVNLIMFRTVLEPAESPNKISHDSQIITMGSCFADTIGAQLKANKFDVLVNPFGVVYSPIALLKQLDYCLREKEPDPITYLENQGVHLNYDFHSSLSALNQEELELKIRGSIQTVKKYLTSADWLFITLGTSIVYIHKESGESVANCHKIAAREFDRTFVSQKTVLEKFDITLKMLGEVAPKLRILLSVSPVRHLKESFEDNSVSKSILRLAAYTLQQDHSNVEYFPAYELLLDDLRDYRFYGEDMVHPNDLAENYIWQRFGQTFFGAETKKIIESWESITKALNHRPFHRSSQAHQKFLKETLTKVQAFSDRFDVSREMEQLQEQLS